MMADRFKDHAIFDPLAQGEDVLTGMHANTQIPKVLGWNVWARFATMNADAATNTFWDSVIHHRSVSIGAHSVSEHFHPTDDFSSMIESREGPENLQFVQHVETCGTTVAAFRQRRLYQLLRAGAGKSSAVHHQSEAAPGFVYFTPMRSQHYRAYSTPKECFWCCVGSGLENHARYGRLFTRCSGRLRRFG